MTAQTLSQKFAAQYAKGVVPAALDAMNLVKRNTKRIAVMALAVSTPHQALYLYGLDHPTGALHIAAAVFFALMIPATIDLGMITMLSVTQTVGLSRRAKTRAMGVLAVLVVVSAGVNIAAPGPLTLRLLTGFTALVLAAVEWVASSIAPDFAALESVEADVAAPVAKGKAKSARSAAAAKGWQTRRDRNLAALAAMAAGYVPANAPTSPAPAGR